MSIWGDLMGDTTHSTHSLLTGQQEQAMSQMGTQANRMQSMGQNQTAIDAKDPGQANRMANLKTDVLARADRDAKNAMHSGEMHSGANMLKRAGIKQGANMSLADMEQQNLQQQLRNQEQANINNEYMRRQYFQNADQLRRNIVGTQAIENVAEQNSGFLGNALGLANMGVQAVNMVRGN